MVIHSPIVVVTIVVSAIVVALALRWLRKSPLGSLPYPPGPPESSLILGNASDIPTKQPWLRYTEWAEIYGDVVHLRVVGSHYLIINSIEAAVELLDKRSSITSGRPRSFLSSLMGLDWNLTFIQHDERWRWHRRAFQKEFRRQIVHSHQELQRAKINDMLKGLLHDPQKFRDSFRTVGAAVIMKILYDHDIDPHGDVFAHLVEECVAIITASTYFGLASVALNYLPVLRYLPSWFPGASFQKIVRESRDALGKCFAETNRMVNTKMEDGTLGRCFVSQLMQDKQNQNNEWVNGACMNGYFAATDTTSSVLSTFMFLMAKYPDIQNKAQQEINNVIGEERLPDFDDLESLPYTQALCREVLRLAPPTLLGIPHASDMEDTYKGYYIPKDSVLVPNMWAMSRDPVKYKQPHEFNPSRFFDSSGSLNKDEVEFVFGFGRRICPGRYLAFSTEWLAIVRILSLFNIRNKKDADGNPMPLEMELSEGIITQPSDYDVDIVPRTSFGLAAQRIAEADKSF